MFNVALTLAGNEAQDCISKCMESANEYHKQLSSKDWETPFKQTDIQFCKFYEQANLTRRERDMIYIAHFLHQCYVELHVTVLALGECVSLDSKQKLTTLFDMLKKYNLTNILLNDKITDDQFFEIMAEQ